jgi:hypothetical protein
VTPEVVVSLVTAVLSLVVSIGTVLLAQRAKQASDVRMEELRSQLAAAKSEQDARRDYEYEAWVGGSPVWRTWFSRFSISIPEPKPCCGAR